MRLVSSGVWPKPCCPWQRAADPADTQPQPPAHRIDYRWAGGSGHYLKLSTTHQPEKHMALHTFTAVGMVCSDPHYKQTAPGQGVVSFRLRASNATRGPDGQWSEHDCLWLTVEAWGILAENVRRSIAKLMQVIVVGTLVTREYVSNAGDNRQSFILKATAIGPDLRRVLIQQAAQHSRRDAPGAELLQDLDEHGLHTWVDSSLVEPRYNERTRPANPEHNPTDNPVPDPGVDPPYTAPPPTRTKSHTHNATHEGQHHGQRPIALPRAGMQTRAGTLTTPAAAMHHTAALPQAIHDTHDAVAISEALNKRQRFTVVT